MATCKECNQEFTPAAGGNWLMPSIPIETCPPCTEVAEVAFKQLLTEATPRVFITPTLIVLNLAVFVAMVVTGVSLFDPRIEQLIKWGADFGPLTFDGEWWRMLSSVFVHIGVVHLLLNMWCLWSLGRLAERMFGNWTFLALYLVSGLGGSLASLWWNPEVVSAGASGAVFGVAGGVAAFWLFGKMALPRSIIKRDFTSILTFVSYNLFYGFAKEGVDNAAHLGGLLVGFGLGALLHRSLPAMPLPAMALPAMALPVTTLPVTAARSRLRVGLVCAGAVLLLIPAAMFARQTHASLVSHQRGLKYMENDFNDRAIEEFQRTVTADPAFALAHNNLGVAYLRQERYEQALAAFQKSLELNPNTEVLVLAHYNLGLAYSALSRDDEAIEAFKQSLQLNPQNADTHFWLGAAYLSRERYDEAIAALQQSLKLNPAQPGAQAELGAAYEAKELYDQALAAYQEALKLDPANEQVKEALNTLNTRTPVKTSVRRQ